MSLFEIDQIGRSLLFTTVRVVGKKASGTAFFYDGLAGVDHSLDQERPDRSVGVLVTNKHVVEATDGGTIQLIRASDDGKPRLGESFELSVPADEWTGHPSEDVDVAVLPIQSSLNQLASKGQPIFMRHVSRELLPDADTWASLDVAVPIEFIGYPSGLFDQKHLTPITRQGTTATPLQLDYCGIPGFLIDASVFPGSSGSPVFIHQRGGYRKDDAWVVSGDRLLFAGIVAEVHLHHTEGKLILPTSQAIPTPVTPQFNDLGIVFTPTVIEETVDHMFKQRGIDRNRLLLGD